MKLINPITIVAVAFVAMSLGCGGDTPTAPALPDGPFVEINLPEFIDPQGPNTLVVRAGVRDKGTVTYTQGAEVLVDIDEGDSDDTAGLTDAQPK